jgi:hypothetical protein
MKSINTFVARIAKEIAPPLGAPENERRVVRRKVSHVLALCGRKAVTQGFLAELEAALKAARVFTNRPLAGRALFQKDWLHFSNAEFPLDAVVFARERDLCEFIRRALGLLPELAGLREVGEEFRLGSGQRIDLLCEEVAQSGRGDLVAIELKRGDPGYGGKTQLDVYLEALSRHPKAKGRQVRGLIISGPDDDSRSAAGASSKHRIDWYCYRVRLEKISRTAVGSSTDIES